MLISSLQLILSEVNTLKLFSPGKQFQTFNVHQLLHLPEVVKDLGPLWSNSCFPFEDYNGDLRELFHGTKNVDGQVSFHIMFML